MRPPPTQVGCELAIATKRAVLRRKSNEERGMYLKGLVEAWEQLDVAKSPITEHKLHLH